MKNKKLILIIIISVVGVILLTYGIINMINNNKNNTKVDDITEQDDYDPDSYNEYRDLEGLENDLVISDFKYENQDGKCEFNFTLINNKEVDINNEILKINFYDENKNLLNTFEYTIDYLGVHDLAEIKYHVNVNSPASIFDYEFENTTKDIEVS